MPDSRGKACYECQVRFTALRRRHHCRICGQIFCVKCCHLAIPGHLLGYTGDLRVCNLCAKAVVQYVGQSELPMSLKRSLLNTLSEGDDRQPSVEPPGEDNGLGSSMSPSMSAKHPKYSTTEDLTPLLGSADEMPSWPDGLPPASQQMSLSAEDVRLPESRSPSPLVMDDILLNTVGPDTEMEEPDWLRNLEPTGGQLFADSSANTSGRVSSSSTTTLVFNRSAPPALSLPIEEVESHPLSVSHPEPPPTPTEPCEGGQKIAVAFHDYQEKMLDYLLRRERLPAEWRGVIMPLAREISHSIRPNTRDRNDRIDVAHYLHVKLWQDPKSAPSSRVVFGTMFSKAVEDSRMRKRIPHPRIVVARGGIEYERINRFTSFEPILTQEESHLGALVAKIEALNPDVVVVEQTVARTALSALQAAGITLLSNVKPVVIDRIARATGAEIVMSVESLFTPPRLGTCGLFRAEELEANGVRKHVIFLEDCQPDLSCGVVLTGARYDHLVATKHVLVTMTRMVYSGKLQQSILSLYSVLYRPVTDNRPSACFACLPQHAKEGKRSSRGNNVATLRDVIDQCCLHSSPLIATELPFLEVPGSHDSPLRRYFKGTLYPFDSSLFDGAVAQYQMSGSTDGSVVDPAGSDGDSDDVTDENRLPRPVAREPQLVSCKLTQPLHSDDMQTLLAEYRARSAGYLREKIDREELLGKKSSRAAKSHLLVREEKPLDVLSPSLHQRLVVLFSCFSDRSQNAPGFCTNPFVVSMSFYGSGDLCLGDFLERYCFSPKYNCVSLDCDVPMLFHVRKLVHGNHCLTITTDAIVDSPPSPASPELITWAFCVRCKTPTQQRPLPLAAWQLSFATFLLYLFRGRNVFVSTCSHCLTHEHHWFFSANNRVTCFKLSPILIHDLTFASPYCMLNNPSLDMAAVWKAFDAIFTSAEMFFASVETQMAFYDSKKLTKTEETKTMFAKEKESWQEARESFSTTDQYDCESLAVLDKDYILLAEQKAKFLHKLATLLQNWNLQLAVFARRLKDEKSERKAVDNADSGSQVDQHEDSPKSQKTIPSALSIPVLPAELHASLPLTTPPVMVNEHEISSVIAYALASPDYREAMATSRDQFSSMNIAINLKDSAPTDNSLAGSLSTADPSNPWQHIEVQFSDATTNIYCKVYFAEHFRLFRKLIFPQGEDTLIRSLAASKAWKPKGGKSGAAFYKTRDDRLILKQMSRFELQGFLKFASSYLNYVTVACTENKLTALAKIVGVFRVGLRNQATGTAVKMDLMVTENLFYDCGPLTQIYDLKGSKRNRLVDDRAVDAVLMDENFVRSKVDDPLYVYPHR